MMRRLPGRPGEAQQDPTSRGESRKERAVSLSTILEAPEHEFDDEEWEDDEEFGADEEELELDEYDESLEDGDEDEDI
jgi:hypothetical protein